ncbi:unnamed protein product [Cylicocyclus nassatus]|uniref:Glycine N-acyltransferase-like protein n=1 Tax=Cylicocyclus nassatus TaxID=53992 RepID=A0AA36HHL5_CYLNA|nr:unnamed protein product [Cylicocyclus nassatus]
MIMLKEPLIKEREEAFELTQNNSDLLFIHAALCSTAYGLQAQLFAYPFNSPKYWFLLQTQKNTPPLVTVAQDGDFFDKNIFLTALRLFFEKTSILRIEHKLECLAEAHLMHEIAKYVMHAEGHRPGTRHEHHVFFMTADQIDRVQKIECTLPYGFENSELNVEDAEEISILSETKQTVDSIRRRIEYLPSACIRQSSSGKVVSRELRSFSGAMVDQYTAPDYRRQGLGQTVEIILAQKIITLDETPFKLVPTYLTSILFSSQESPFWSIWSRNNLPVSFVKQAFKKLS